MIRIFPWLVGIASAGAIAACSSDEQQAPPPKTPDAGGGAGGSGGTSGSAGTGGRGGTSGSGGTAGTGGTAGSGGSDGTVRCGSTTCRPAAVSSTVTLQACCPSGTIDRCGLDVGAAAALVGLSAGCIETNQPGTTDASCPAVSAPRAIDGGPAEFAGCCTPGGTCGARVDLRSLASGLDFGCVGTASLLDAGAPRSCGATDAGDAGDGAVPPMCSDAAPCSWKQATPAVSPPVLAWPAAAYDPVADRIILFGGAPSINGGTPTAEMWAWNGSNWSELTPARKPPARWTHGMAYDEDRRRIVLFGGLATDQASGALNDTWEWDGTNWTQVSTAAAPSARGIHGAITYDSSRKRVVLRGGGIVPGQPIFGDTWTYDGANWSEVTGSGPSPRVAPAVAYDKARNEIVLFGGGTWSPYFGDTWRWNGTSWSELTPARAPSARQSARMIYDSTRSLILLFGGADSQFKNDLWQWDGQNWTEVIVSGPPPRCCFAFAHDTKRNQAVLFGGPDNQTWLYGN